MYQAPTVKKAFQILDLVARRDKRLTISDLSRELGISKSTVHGIIQALEEAGAVVRDQKTRCYSLGMAFFELAQAVYARIDLKSVARPVMEELMRETRESVFLGIRFNDRVSIIDIVESTQDLKITAPVGARLPLLIGALGKVFMASLTDREAAQLVRDTGLRRDTEKSIIDPDKYLEEVRAARRSGFALDDEEYIQGVRAVAAPIPIVGRPVSAIWIVGFTQSIAREKMSILATKTKHAAEAISRKVDFRPVKGKVQ